MYFSEKVQIKLKINPSNTKDYIGGGTNLYICKNVCFSITFCPPLLQHLNIYNNVCTSITMFTYLPIELPNLTKAVTCKPGILERHQN